MSETQEPKHARTPTIRDVAVLAGVSIGTVSKALNGRQGVGARTRANVLKAAEQLGFHSNALARNLLTGRSFTVGLITNDSFGRFSIPVMLGAEDALQTGQIAVLLCDGRDDAIREQHYVRTLLSRRVDGIIVTGRRIDPRPPVNTDIPIPIVYAMSESTNPKDASVLPDDEGGGRLAVEHLLATGRRKIGHITGPADFRAAQLRAAGASAALTNAGLAIAGDGPLHGQWSEEWGRQAASIMLRQTPDVDAVFCGSDQIARGVSEYLREIGCNVPDDVALVGFDNWTVMAEAARPSLTTIDMNLSEVGRTAAQILLAAIDGNETQGTRLVPSQLVVRASTRPPDISYKDSVSPSSDSGAG
ncbi:MAG: LacI family DNA-binding transcriptional regulator [Acidimicrobiales bacterium]